MDLMEILGGKRKRRRDEVPPSLLSLLGYPSNLITAEISTRVIPIVRPSLKRTRNFLPYCATISTEIGGVLDLYRIAHPPKKRQ